MPEGPNAICFVVGSAGTAAGWASEKQDIFRREPISRIARHLSDQNWDILLTTVEIGVRAALPIGAEIAGTFRRLSAALSSFSCFSQESGECDATRENLVKMPERVRQ